MGDHAAVVLTLSRTDAMPRTVLLILRRLALAAGLVLAVLAVNFMLIHAAPGDPALVIAGEKDPGSPPAEGAKIVAAIPGAESFVVPGGYHLCNVEFPHVFTERCLSFLLDRK